MATVPLIEALEDAEHTLSLGQWAALLLAADPKEYAAAPAPEKRTSCPPGSEGKIAVMARRRKRRQTLGHEDDTTADDIEHLGRKISTRRNGSVERHGLRIAGEPDAPMSLIDELRAELDAQARRGWSIAREISDRITAEVLAPTLRRAA